MNVLFFGTDSVLARLVEEGFGQKWEITHIEDLDEVADFRGTHLFQGAIVEVGVCDTDATGFAKQAKHHLRIPVVMGLVPRSISDRLIETHSRGIDIFFDKSGSDRIVKQQCDAALRLANDVDSEDIVCGQVTYHTARNVFSVIGRDIHLPYKKHRLLQLFFLKQGRTVTKEMVFNYLYGWEEPPHEKIVDVFVCQLRKQLRELGALDEVIRTVWGQGYTVPRAATLSTSQAA